MTKPKLERVPLTGEPATDRAYRYKGRLWRVRSVTTKRAQGHDAVQMTVAALNDDMTMHQHAGGYIITDVHTITLRHTTVDIETTLEAEALRRIEECMVRLNNQPALDIIERGWGA